VAREWPTFLPLSLSHSINNLNNTITDEVTCNDDDDEDDDDDSDDDDDDDDKYKKKKLPDEG